MKKIIALLLIAVCCLALCACGSKAEPTTSAPEGMTSTLPGANLQSSSSDNTEEDDDPNFILAQSFKDKSVDELIAVLGEPKSREYTSSCLGNGEDGNLEYEGFYVYTYKEGNVETVKEVYK